MDPLERYLDQVCRGIRGPRSLRRHIRQELREHLIDAADEHRQAGLSPDEALARAIDDFGGADQVRSELEATHGHRLMAVVLDKALEWKEMTMKTKWFWSAGADLALAGAIGVQVLFFCLAMVLIVPSYEKFRQDGLLEITAVESQVLIHRADAWLQATVRIANHLANYWWLWTLLLAVAWGVFERRVRSENKSLVRLSVLGVTALGLAGIVGLTASSLIVPFTCAIPTMYVQLPESVVRDEIAAANASASALDQSLAAKDWASGREHALGALHAVGKLAGRGATAAALLSLGEQGKIDDARAKLDQANDCILSAYQAVERQDSVGAEAALEKFRDVWKQVPGMGP